MQPSAREVKGWPKYSVSSEGVITNVETKRRLKASNEHYPRVRLYRAVNGITAVTAIAVHRCVAMAWVENPRPEQYDIVNHKDGNTSNYHANNLEWTDTAGNLEHARRTGLKEGERINSTALRGIETTHGGIVIFRSVPAARDALGGSIKALRNVIGTGKPYRGFSWDWVEPDTILGERWRTLSAQNATIYNPSCYEVSDHGRVRNVGSGRHLQLHLRKDGYYMVQLSAGSKNSKSVPAAVHRLVAMAFLPEHNVSDDVDHINTIRTDNRACNLQWLARTRHAIKTHGKRVLQTNCDGTVIGAHESIIAAARSVHKHRNMLAIAIAQGTACEGYYWKLSADEVLLNADNRVSIDAYIDEIMSEM